MNLIQSIYDVLFPVTCPICGQVTGYEYPVCPECLAQLPRTNQYRILDNITEDRLQGPAAPERAIAYLYYDRQSAVQTVIHAAKYNRQPMVVYQLALAAGREIMAVSDFFDDIDVIIPIPLHQRRLRQRGFNQANYIADALSRVTGIPVDTTHVTRIKNNPHQARQNAQEREWNTQNLFGVNHPEELYWKHILLVDDVITTGATVRSCLQTMQAFRGSKIKVFALGKAR